MSKEARQQLRDIDTRIARALEDAHTAYQKLILAATFGRDIKKLAAIDTEEMSDAVERFKNFIIGAQDLIAERNNIKAEIR